MVAIAQKLDSAFNRWRADTASEVTKLVSEIIDMADHDALDLARGRKIEQDVLDMIDEPPAG